MITRILGIAITVLVEISGEPAAGECFQYEPSEATLTGTLVARSFPGPPNYESVSEGDAPEGAIVLVLSASICVAADPTSEVNSEGVTGVRELQLVLYGSEHKALLGQRVRVTGSLFSAHTGHHHTRILMAVAKLRAA